MLTIVTGGGDGDRSAHLLVELDSIQAVLDVTPHMNTLVRLPCRGVIVTAPGTDGVDFVSRVFAPAYGISENPVTGSAHCLLAPFWSARRGKRTLLARQMSRQGGDLRLELADDDRVRIGGQAVTVARTELVAGDG